MKFVIELSREELICLFAGLYEGARYFAEDKEDMAKGITAVFEKFAEKVIENEAQISAGR